MYKLIEWPDIQELMDKPGFKKNCCLANDPKFLKHNTVVNSSAYFVRKKWYKKVMPQLGVSSNSLSSDDIRECYLCKETEDQVTILLQEGDRFICDNCIANR